MTTTLLTMMIFETIMLAVSVWYASFIKKNDGFGLYLIAGFNIAIWGFNLLWDACKLIGG